MRFLNIFFSRDKYTKGIQLNNILIMLFRGAGILCNLYLVPVTLNYLDKSNYGVWLTLTSIISWLSFMDIGLGNGMRNKLAELTGINSNQILREYVSTTYGVFSAIIIGFFIIFSVFNPLIPWNSILKTNMSSDGILILSYIIVFSFSIRLVLDLASMIVVALHKPFIKAFIEFLFNGVTLLLVYTLTFFHYKSLILYGAIVSLVPVLILLIFSIILFREKSAYNYLSPSPKYFNRKLIGSLFGLGIQFFIIQIAALIVFSTDNILITQLFSPKEVTKFNIVYKYFSVITLGFMIVLTPYWSSFTTAFFGNHTEWIKSAFKRLLFIWVGQVVITAVFILLAPLAYRLWIGKSLGIERSVSFWMGTYVVISNWNNLFVYFLNGVSKIRLQLYSSIVISIINIPLAYYLVKYTSMGLTSIIIANSLCLLICSLWAPVQCYKIINGSAKGIWEK